MLYLGKIFPGCPVSQEIKVIYNIFAVLYGSYHNIKKYKEIQRNIKNKVRQG